MISHIIDQAKMLSDAIQADGFSPKNMEMKSDLSSCLFPNQPLAQQHLSLSRMRDFISLVLSYPMKIADKGMLKNWINDVYLAQSCSKTEEEEQCLCAKNPLRYVEGLVPDDILHKVRHGLRPIFNINEPRTPKELSASASSGGLAALTDGIDVIPQAIVNLAIDLAVEQLIQTLLSSNHIHHVRLSTRNNAEKRIVMEKIESALKKEDNMLGIGSAFQRILHIDTSKYLSKEVFQVQLEIAKQTELMKAIEDDTKYEHVFLKKHIEEEMMHKNHLVLLVDRDGDTKLDPKKLGFPKTGIAGTVVLITTESSTQENDELRREMDLEIMTEDHLLPWELFLRLVGGDLICLSGVIQNIAVRIVTECGGHLLAIAIVAKWLKDVEDVRFWESALYQLRSKDSSCDRQSAYPINSSPRVMFNAFKNFYWDNLEMTEKHCLTRCLFIPGVKDGKLEHQLMNDWVSSLLVESEEEAQDNLTEFVDCFILLQFEQNGGKYIRLPPETFDVLQSLHTLNPSFIVQDGKGLTEPPNTEVWHEVVKIQLADNKLSELPPSPNCLELKVLMLQGNPDLTEMPPDFFVHMPLLRILDLSYTSVKDLPTSFFDMEQLTELYLKGCQRFMKLPREVGKLKKLEKLDLDETQIIHLPEEIQNLSNLYSLTLCFYEYHGKKGMQYSCKTIIPSGVISKLIKLKHLSIDVHPDDERWYDNLRVILSEIVGLECLQTLSLHIPQAELLKLVPAHIFELDFRFVVGLHMKRIISGTIPTYEAKFKQSECSLKFVKGREVPYEIKKLLAFSKGFFLDRHMTINSLSEFEMENLEQLRFCILAECKEMQTIVDGRSSNRSKDILPHLLYLSVSYMKNLKNIWQGPAPFPFAFGMLKSLSLHACPKLTTIFTLDFLRNMSLLKELIVNDCPKVSSLISPESSEAKSQIFLPRLRKVFLLYLPELISISNGLHIGPKLETIVCYDCPRLQRLSNMELSSENLIAIKGETNWWEALKWSEVEWGKAGRPSKFNTIFSSINEKSDIVSQLGMYSNDEIDDDSGETVSEPCQVSTEISIATKDTYDNSSLAVDAPSQSKGIKEFRPPRLKSQERYPDNYESYCSYKDKPIFH